MRSLAYKAIALIISAFAALQTVNAEISRLPLPEVPDSLRSATLRADYIIEHFWDAMDFSKTPANGNRELMSAGMADFLSVFPHATEAGRTTALNRLAKLAAPYPDAAQTLSEVAEEYMFVKTSPMRDESLYIVFINAMLDNGFPNEIRNRWMLEMIMKNRPGSDAPDFKFETRDGTILGFREHTSGAATILIFYDPDCEDCSAVINELEEDYLLKTRVEKGLIKLVAIYPDGDKEKWYSIRKIPEGWTDGFDTGMIIEEDLYMISATPTIYFIDADGKIILKDANVAELLDSAYKIR